MQLETMKMKKKTLPSSTRTLDTSYSESIKGEDLEECYNGCLHGEKKLKCRRLNIEQLRALEKSFVLEKRVEPENKLKLARALGLNPRQITIWFQNRRARCKTKQLEKDFGVLKQDYEAFKTLYRNTQEENNKLRAEIHRLSNICTNENQGQTFVDVENIKEINEGVYSCMCNSIQYGSCIEHEGFKSSMEGCSMNANVLAKLEEKSLEEEEPCYYNLDEKTHLLWDRWP